MTDPVTKQLVSRKTLIMYVDREDGLPVSKTLSVVSERLAGDLAGYLEGKRYLTLEFTLEKASSPFAAPRVAGVAPYVL